MRLLLDECMPRRLKREFVGHEVKTAREAGFAGLKNGALLRAADASFDVLITVDRNIPYQQNLSGLNIAIMILITKSNRYDDLKPLVPQLYTRSRRYSLGPSCGSKFEGSIPSTTRIQIFAFGPHGRNHPTS